MKATIRRLLIGLAIAVGVFAATLGVRQRIVSRSDAAESSTITEAPPPASQPVVPLEKILHATIVEIPGDDALVAESDKHGRLLLRLTPSTRIWKGGWDSGRPIEVGDYFWGYGEPDEEDGVWIVEQMEVNIMNLRGHVVRIDKSSGGLDLQLEDVHDGHVYQVRIVSDSEVVSETLGDQAMAFGETDLEIVVGDGLQVVGLKLKDDSVLATTVFH
jgi:hypothetical protein